MEGFCQKDNIAVDLEKGCRHPNDYCQYRQACMIHFHELEQRRSRNNIVDSKDGHKDHSAKVEERQDAGSLDK